MFHTGIRILLLLITLGALAACEGGGGHGTLEEGNSSSGVDTGSEGDIGDDRDEGDSGTTTCGEMTGMACEVLMAVNQERGTRGLAALAALSQCVLEAQSHATDMVQRDFFAHDSPTETTSQRFARFGLANSYWGENIAAGYKSAAQVMAGWMSSTGHRNNILSPNFRSMGVGMATDAQGMVFWVQCFSGMNAG